MHFCENPHEVFSYYAPGEGNRFCEVEADELSTEKENNSKRACKKLTVKAEINVFQICHIAVQTFFQNFEFNRKINSAETNNAGSYGAANAGNGGAASVEKNGVAICSTSGKVKGGINSILVLVNRDDYGHIIEAKMEPVDGERIKANTWYRLENGEFKELQ